MNRAVLRARLDEALEDHPGVTVTWREIIDPQQAERAGMPQPLLPRRRPTDGAADPRGPLRIPP
ncbi:hypothetical protein [Streptomyces regalis]|uniref:hypothetical protein n=1 Tax=Streptomyces regalis TaxID=68262 RepID=UPI00131DE32A|nr:hypothetical protein [Streptomyces regalis]